MVAWDFRNSKTFDDLFFSDVLAPGYHGPQRALALFTRRDAALQYRDRTGAAHDIIAIYSRDLLRRLLLGAAACKVALLAIDPMAEANEAVTILSIDNLVAQLKGSGK